MSYSTILKVSPGKHPVSFKELHNSYGSAPVIWNTLCQEYYGTKWFSSTGDILDRLWSSWKDLSIPEYKRALLMMTFDHAYVRKEHFARAAKDIRKWIETYPQDDLHVNHWPAIAEVYESDPDCYALAIYQTSVSENPFQGPYNEEKDDYDLIDWITTYEIYEELDSLCNKGVQETK